MLKRLIILLVASIGSVLLAAPSNAAAPVTGKPCTKLGATTLYQFKNYTCIKSGKKLVWSKPVAVTPIAPKPTPTPTPTPTPGPQPPTTPTTPTYLQLGKGNMPASGPVEAAAGAAGLTATGGAAWSWLKSKKALTSSLKKIK